MIVDIVHPCPLDVELPRRKGMHRLWVRRSFPLEIEPGHLSTGVSAEDPRLDVRMDDAGRPMEPIVVPNESGEYRLRGGVPPEQIVEESAIPPLKSIVKDHQEEMHARLQKRARGMVLVGDRIYERADERFFRVELDYKGETASVYIDSGRRKEGVLHSFRLDRFDDMEAFARRHIGEGLARMVASIESCRVVLSPGLVLEHDADAYAIRFSAENIVELGSHLLRTMPTDAIMGWAALRDELEANPDLRFQDMAALARMADRTMRDFEGTRAGTFPSYRESRERLDACLERLSAGLSADDQESLAALAP